MLVPGVGAVLTHVSHCDQPCGKPVISQNLQVERLPYLLTKAGKQRVHRVPQRTRRGWCTNEMFDNREPGADATG